MPPRRATRAAMKCASAAAPRSAAAKSKSGTRRMSSESEPETPSETSDSDTTAVTAANAVIASTATGEGTVVMMDRNALRDLIDEVYHAHDDDEAEEEPEEEWENSFDAPRFDFFFSDHTTAQQRTLVYRTATLFSSAPPSAPLHEDEYVEEWVDRSNVSVEGPGGPLTMEEEDDFHLEARIAEQEARESAGSEGHTGPGAVDGDSEMEEEEETERKPYMIVFPSAKRVIDFIAYLGSDGLHNIWLKSETEGEEPDEEEYEPQTRLWWRMNESEWIPAHC